MKYKFKKIIQDNKAQVSVEFLVILGVVILAAMLIGFYLKQMSAKSTAEATDYQEKALGN
jgi:uncharacterized protein (UPF0333 family)